MFPRREEVNLGLEADCSSTGSHLLWEEETVGPLGRDNNPATLGRLYDAVLIFQRIGNPWGAVTDRSPAALLALVPGRPPEGTAEDQSGKGPIQGDSRKTKGNWD